VEEERKKKEEVEFFSLSAVGRLLAAVDAIRSVFSTSSKKQQQALSHLLVRRLLVAHARGARQARRGGARCAGRRDELVVGHRFSVRQRRRRRRRLKNFSFSCPPCLSFCSSARCVTDAMWKSRRRRRAEGKRSVEQGSARREKAIERTGSSSFAGECSVSEGKASTRASLF